MDVLVQGLIELDLGSIYLAGLGDSPGSIWGLIYLAGLGDSPGSIWICEPGLTPRPARKIGNSTGSIWGRFT